MSFGSSKKSTTSSQDVKPWDVTIPGLTDITNKITNDYLPNSGITSEQQSAFNQLKANANAGNPLADEAMKAATDMTGVQSRAGMVTDAYGNLQRNLGDMAAGKNLDVANNPQVQKLLSTIGDDIANRTRSLFAGSGRPIAGNAAGMQALGRGMEQGLAPILLNQYNQEVQNMQGANNTLFGGANTAATSADTLDRNALSTRLAGATTGAEQAMKEQNYGANELLNLATQEQQLPWINTGTLEGLLGPIAQLGGTQNGTSTTKGSSSSFNVGSIIGAMAMLSDERVKDNKEVVGSLADGTPIYSFTYKGDPQKRTHIGVMAQDVEEDNPEADAVVSFGGIKGVDYKKATRRSAKMMKGAEHGYA